MSRKQLLMIGMVAGSTAGGFIPTLWGGGFLSFTSVLFSGLGGLLGIWIAHRLGRQL